MKLSETRCAVWSFLWIVAQAAFAHAENEPTAIYTMKIDGSQVRMIARIDG